MRHARALTAAVLFMSAALLVGCGRTVTSTSDGSKAPTPASQPSASETITVLAAASLSRPFDELGKEFERSHPGVAYRGSYAGTQELLAQMERGVKADVFASASQEQMSSALTKKLVADPHVFATNKLCIVVSPKAQSIATIGDLAKSGVKLVVAVEKSPIGKYTRAALDKLAADKGYGPTVVKGIRANVRSEETDVKLVLSRVELGEADAGFVYASDAAGAGDAVRTVAIPDSLNVTASYPLAVCAGAPSAQLAAQFVELVTGPDGQAILAKHGFQPPPAAK